MQNYNFESIKININNIDFLLDIEYIYNNPSDKTIIIINLIKTDNNNNYNQLNSYIDYTFGEDYNYIKNNLINKAMVQILEYCEIIK